MRISIALVLSASISSISWSQHSENVRRYFDKEWMEVYNPSQAAYYRIVEEINGMYLVSHYYAKNDSIEMQAVCSEVFPELLREGESIWYYSNGVKRKEGFYQNNKESGLFKIYYKTGQLRGTVFYSGESERYLQFWSPAGKELLMRGTGLVPPDSASEESPYYLEIKDSLLVGKYQYDPQHQSIYLVVEKTPEYPGGLKEFYEVVAKNLAGHYPAEARRKGIQGNVFVEFVIDENCKMVSTRIIKGIGGGCDQLVLEIFERLQTKWTPAFHNGSPVACKMVLPIVFKLG